MKINRTNDYVFAKIFGDPKNKDIALSLINSVFEFEGTELIDDITFQDRTLMPEYEDGKLSRLDILGYTKKGEKVNIEMQVINEHNMERRTLYYWSKLYTNLEKGKNYSELARTVTINILNFDLLPCDMYHSMYGLYNLQNQHLLTKDLEIHFIEMPKWRPQNAKEMKRLDRWLAYFTNKLSDEEMEAIVMREPAIQKAIQIESMFTTDQILRREYEQREKAIMDYNSAMSASKKIGREETLKEVALSLIKMSTPIETITKATGFTIDQIKDLQK